MFEARETYKKGRRSLFSAEMRAKNMLKKIGKFEIIRELGRGAMGRVYAARDEERRVCALKVLNRGKIPSGKLLARFEREAHLLQSLDHPNIIKLYEIGENEGLSYFAMELAKGKELAQIIPKTGMDFEQAFYIIQRVALACEHAHSRGIIHRDLKPQNIIVDGFGNPHVMDFGIAKNLEAEEETALTKTGALLGTPAFMSPEQAEGKTHEIDHQADVYALGSTLYNMLAGRPPFEGANASQILMRVIKEEPTPLKQIRPDLPDDVIFICQRAMSKLKRERYKTAKDFALDIERWFRGRDVIATERTPFERFLGFIVTHKKIAFLCFISAIFLLFASLLLNRSVDQASTRVTEQLKIYENEASGYLRKENFTYAEESASLFALLDENWNGQSVQKSSAVDKMFQQIEQSKHHHLQSLLQQGKSVHINTNQASEKFAEVYVHEPEFLNQEGKVYFCYGKWWTEQKALERGYLLPQGDKFIHEADKFSFPSKFPGEVFNESGVQKRGLAYKFNGKWLTREEAEAEGIFFVESQGKWLTGEDAVNEGCLYYQDKTKQYLNKIQANRMGAFFDHELTRKWYIGDDAQRRGLTFKHASRWLEPEEARKKGFIFIPQDKYFGEWKDRDELWLGGIDRMIIHRDSNQLFTCIRNVKTKNWVLGYDVIGQIKIWDTQKIDPQTNYPEELRTIFGVPSPIHTMAFDIRNSTIIVPHSSGIYGYPEKGSPVKSKIQYPNVVSSAFGVENDLMLALLSSDKVVVNKLKTILASKAYARYECIPPELNKAELTHATLADDGRSLVAMNVEKEFFIFYLDTNLGTSAEVRGIPIRLENFQSTHRQRKIAAISTINREYLAVSFADSPFEVELWNMEKGFKRKILKEHTNKVTSISFGINSESLTTCGEDGQIILWSIRTN